MMSSRESVPRCWCTASGAETAQAHDQPKPVSDLRASSEDGPRRSLRSRCQKHRSTDRAGGSEELRRDDGVADKRGRRHCCPEAAGGAYAALRLRKLGGSPVGVVQMLLKVGRRAGMLMQLMSMMLILGTRLMRHHQCTSGRN
jgi:hypothetical protein